MEKNKKQNINIFKKVWYSILKFEKYPDMAAEGFTTALKYLACLMLVLTLLITINSLIETRNMVLGLSDYIEKNIPDFSYAEGKITMNIQERIEIDNISYSGIDYIIIEPNVEEDEQKDNIIKSNEKMGITVYFFKNQIILENKIENRDSVMQEYTYQDFIKSYIQQDIKQFNKLEMINYMRSTEMNNFYIRYGASLLMYFILLNILITLFDALQLSILGWITSIIAKVKIRFVAIYNMAIYSLTISILLNYIYIIINYFVDYNIPYFSIAYIAIAYICLVAAIFIIKDDCIKKQIEVEKIEEEQKKIKQEIIQQEQDNKEKEKNEKDEDNKTEENNKKREKNNGEPNGSQA